MRVVNVYRHFRCGEPSVVLWRSAKRVGLSTIGGKNLLSTQWRGGAMWWCEKCNHGASPDDFHAIGGLSPLRLQALLARHGFKMEEEQDAGIPA